MAEVTSAEHPDWIWPRADSHIVLSAEGAPEVYKTFVEPGGSFSPGVGSFGVSVWVWLEDEQRLVAPELLPREAIRDRLLGGILPICRSRWRAGALELDLRLAAEPCPDPWHVLDTFCCRVVNRGRQAAPALVLLVLRSLGPAGGPLRSIAYNHEVRGFLLHDAVRLLGERPPFEAGCVSLSEDGVDISILLARGTLPTRPRAFDADGYCGGCLAYQVLLEPGGEWVTGWRLPVLPTEPNLPEEIWQAARRPAAAHLEEVADAWRKRLTPVSLIAPDARFPEAFHASLTHLVMAMAGPEARIAPVCYPLPWVRDGVYIINALDKGGLTDLARGALEALAGEPWSGGFGPEADAPGELLWCIAEHYRLTGDRDWLAGLWDRVVERAEWLVRMRSCDAPLRVPAANVLPRTRLHPEQDLVCGPASDGLIQGRMDWHRPLFWVNAFALAGLRAAAELALALGHNDHADSWGREAEELAKALAGLRFGGNERDYACAIWPTEARSPDDPDTLAAFERFWRQRRWDERGQYHREPRWRYFELAQAHNMLRLGRRQEALMTIEQFLRTQDAPGLYAWAEGDATGDPAGLWRLVRGWWPESKIMPHGWASAEMALLLRDLFVFEEGGALVLGAGVAPTWLDSPEGVGIAGAPTRHGLVSWLLCPSGEARAFTLTIRCEPGPPPQGYRLRLPLPPSASVEVEGAGLREEAGDWPLRTDRHEAVVNILVP